MAKYDNLKKVFFGKNVYKTERTVSLATDGRKVFGGIGNEGLDLGLWIQEKIDDGTIVTGGVDLSALIALTGMPAGSSNLSTFTGSIISDNTTIKNALQQLETYIEASIAYTDEQAQDAVGNILIDSSTIDFTYNDGTPSITAIVIDNSITFAKMQTISTNKLLGRFTAGTGNVEQISIGSNLTLAGGTLDLSFTPTSGTVTSVGLSLPSFITVSGSPITSSGTFTGTLATQAANTVFSGPAVAPDATPTFRTLVAADIPTLTSSKISDFSEAVDDRVSTLLVAGTNITLTYNDGADTLTIDASDSSYTDEEAQDAIGTILLDSDTINFAYDDGTPTISADVITQMSITSDSSGLKLLGDATTPGNSKYYGTNSSGTKGFYDVPTAATIPTGTSAQTLRYDSTNTLVANSNILNNGTYVGIGGSPITNYRLYVNGAIRTAGILYSRGSGSFAASLSNSEIRVENTTAVTGQAWYIHSADTGELLISTNPSTPEIEIDTNGDALFGYKIAIGDVSNTPETLIGTDASGYVGEITLGSGLSLTSGTLSVTGGATGYDTIQDNGVDLAQETVLNFVGDSWILTEDTGKTQIELHALLEAIADTSTDGILVRTSSSTVVPRTITGTSGRIAVTNGDGVSGDPTIDLSTTTVTPGSYGSATEFPTFTVDAYGRLTAASNTSITYTNIYTSNGAIPSSTTRTVSLDTSSFLIFEDVTTSQLLNLSTGQVTILDGIVTIDNADLSLASSGVDFTIGTDFLLTLQSTASATITDSRATTVGLEYAADYSADYTNRSLVDKEYVDNAIPSIAIPSTEVVYGNGTGITSTSTFIYSSGQLSVGNATPATSTILTTKGTGTGNSTYGYTHQNSSGTSAFRVSDSGVLTIGTSSALSLHSTAFTPASTYTFATTAATINLGSSGSAFNVNITGNRVILNGNEVLGNELNNTTYTSPSNSPVQNGVYGSIVTTSGSRGLTGLLINHTINQSGTSSGSSRGIYINPTLTAVGSVDYKAIDIGTSSSQMYAIYQSGALSKNYFNGPTSFGSTAADASALVDIVSTTKGFGLPSMTTTQRDAISSPRDGLVIYDSTTDVISLRANGAWVDVTTGGGDGNGIYDGSGTIASSTVATVTSGSSFQINYSSGNPAIQVDDASLNEAVFLYSDSGSSYMYIDDSGFSWELGTSQMVFGSAVGTISADNLTLGPSSGAIINIGGGTSAAEMRFLEPSGSGTNYTGFKAQAMASDVLYTLPAASGTAGQVLTWNASDILTWEDVIAGGDGIYGGSGSVSSLTTVTLGTSVGLYFNYSDNDTALLIDDDSGLILTSPNLSHVISVENLSLNFAAGSDTIYFYSGNYEISTANTSFTGDAISLISTDATGFKLKFMEPSSGSNFTSFRAGTQSADYEYIFPVDTPGNGEVLTFNTGGQLSWETISSGDGNGIYDGSGTLSGSTAVLLPASSTFRFNYNSTNPGLIIDDSDNSATIFSDSGNNYVYVNDTSIDIVNLGKAQLIAAPASDHTYSGTTIILTANENQAFGDVCYINTDGEAQLGDASAIATASCVVMCTETVSANNPATYLLMGVARDDTWAWTVGGLVYLSTTGTTGNTLTQTAPSSTDEVIQIIGVATHADRILFNPNLSQTIHT